MGLIETLKRRLIAPSEALDGYEQPELLDVIFKKTLAYNPREAWPEMADATSVLDFGGGCGLHYKQARSSTVRWAVVETLAMAEKAKELATERLQFFSSIREAADWLGPIDVMHSNGALQYTPEPEQVLEQLCALHARKMMWRRVLLSQAHTEREIQSSFLGDNGPGRIRVKEKTVRYARTKISERTFLQAHSEYVLEARGSDWFCFVR